jgi:acyl-CoA thioester hydrolase
LRVIGVHHTAMLERDPPLAFAITAIACKFQKAARIDDSLTVLTTFDALKGVRLFVSQKILRGDDVIVTADVEAVCIDLQGKPRRLFPELGASLADYLLQGQR